MTGGRQPRGRAFALRDPLPWKEFAGLTRAGEDLGYRAVFLPEIAGRDTLAALTALAGETRELLLGTGIIPAGNRSPKLTAMAAATLQERSGGRAILGLGTGSPRPGSLERLRTLVGDLRGSFAGGLSLPVDQPIPIWIAALGPKAVRLAGEVADGVLLNWCTPERVAEASEGVRVAVYVRASIGTGDQASLVRAAAEYAGYPAYARQFAAMGLDPGDPAGLAATLCLPGDGPEARERLNEYHEAGADMPVVYPVLGGAGVTGLRITLEALAPS